MKFNWIREHAAGGADDTSATATATATATAASSPLPPPASRWPVAVMCDVLGVSRSGYYAWRDRPASPAATRRAELAAHAAAAHADSRGAYGSPRVHAELAARGVRCCVNTVARVMREAGVRSVAHRRFRCRTTDSAHAHPVAPNVLDRDFAADLPDRKWAADITYVATGEGWLYLAAVIDLCTRRVVGWAMADHLRADLCTDALDMALADAASGPAAAAAAAAAAAGWFTTATAACSTRAARTATGWRRTGSRAR